MSRLPPLDPEALSPEQRRVHDAILAGPRGRIEGPLAAWLISPGLAGPAQELGAYLRFRSALPPVLRELAILTVAAHYRAEYEWWAHSRLAREAGLDGAVIEALRTGAAPAFADADQAFVHGLVRTLLARHRLSDAEFAEARGRLGLEGLVDLIGLVGYYGLVSLTLNVFEVETPDGSRAFPEGEEHSEEGQETA